MILDKGVIEDIKNMSGLLFDKAGDFDLLSAYIYKETGRTIGITTLKRLFNYINDERQTSEYTLNTIALYLGHHSWQEYYESKQLDSDWDFNDDAVYISALEVGSRIRIQYLNRIVSFEVCKVGDRNVLKVTSCANSSLMPNDILYVYKICKGEILEAEKVVRGSDVGNYKTRSEISSIELL